MLKLGVVLAGATLTAAQVDTATYCTELLAQCPGKHGFATQQQCTTTMATGGDGYVVGVANESDVDSLECRYKYLVPPMNASSNKCQFAGPTGGGRCGSVVDGACRGATQACAASPLSFADFAECQTGLAALGAQWGWLQGAAAATEDTLECRVYHAIANLVTADPSHCGHYNLTSVQCAGAPAPDPSGGHYCDTIMDACTGANAQYISATSCRKVAMSFMNSPNDTRASNGNNTLGCREYHAQASKVVNATVHCEHAGPSGGGVCGGANGYAQAWASIAKGVCNDTDVEAALMALGAAQLNLAVPDKVGANGRYSIASDTSNNTQACRIYHLTVAADLPSHCPHGSLHGDSQCGGTPERTFCQFVGGVCGFGTAAYQFATEAACLTAVSNMSLGTSADRTQNTLGCRFYHAGVAGSYKAGGNMAANATLANQHCGHVVVPGMGPGACGAPATTTAPSAAPASPTSSAATVSLSLFAGAVGILAL